MLPTQAACSRDTISALNLSLHALRIRPGNHFKLSFSIAYNILCGPFWFFYSDQCFQQMLFKMPMQFSAAVTESGFKSNIWHYMSAPEVNNTFSDVLVWPNKRVHLKLSLVDTMIYYSSCFFKILYPPLFNRIFKPRTVLDFPAQSSSLSRYWNRKTRKTREQELSNEIEIVLKIVVIK